MLTLEIGVFHIGHRIGSPTIYSSLFVVSACGPRPAATATQKWASEQSHHSGPPYKSHTVTWLLDLYSLIDSVNADKACSVHQAALTSLPVFWLWLHSPLWFCLVPHLWPSVFVSLLSYSLGAYLKPDIFNQHTVLLRK